MTETMRPALEGLEVMHPEMDDDQDIVLTVPAGGDHIVVLRRTDASCKYGLQYMTHQRPLTDEEMMQGARDMDDEEATLFDNTSCFYKLFNTPMGACFFFEN